MRGQYHLYNKELLDKALKVALEDKSPKHLQELSEKYKIPLSTIRSHIKQPNRGKNLGTFCFLNNQKNFLPKGPVHPPFESH
jgi:hypothetical protein